MKPLEILPELEGYYLGDVICIPEHEYVKRNSVHLYSFFYSQLVGFARKNGLVLRYKFNNLNREYQISFEVDEYADGCKITDREKLLSCNEWGKPYISFKEKEPCPKESQIGKRWYGRVSIISALVKRLRRSR